MKASARIAAGLAGLVLALPLHGHGPLFLEDEVLAVDEPTLSQVIAGVFETGDEVFSIHLDFVDEGFAFPLELLVPHQPALAGHRPAFAVIGPGLPPPTDAERARIPGDIPDGAGVVVEDNAVDPRPVLFEGFMRRVYWTSRAIAVAVDAGPTEVRVWSPGRTTGKFAVGLGVEEDFGPQTFPPLLEHWSDFAY
jgi:hypothetical protein